MKNAIKRTVRIPITNFVAGSDYTGIFYVGENARKVNLLLDTGSSIPAIALQDSEVDRATATTFFNHLAYGSDPRGFSGPVVRMQLATGAVGPQIILNEVYITAIPPNADRPFGEADGVLGLAYKPLSTSIDLGINTVDYFLRGRELQIKYEYVSLPTYFTALERAGIVPNKFSFYTLRSISHFGTHNPEIDPLNQGYFILGGGEEATDLYNGEFTTVKVVHDVFYNTNMSALYVGDIRIGIPNYPRQPSNSIVDSGTNSISLPRLLFEQVVAAFRSINKDFARAIDSQKVESLEGWPDVTVELEGKSGNVYLIVSPETYWQLNALEFGRSIFRIIPFDSPPVILGLPLMNNYYTVFDRSADRELGVIKFAPIQRP